MHLYDFSIVCTKTSGYCPIKGIRGAGVVRGIMGIGDN